MTASPENLQNYVNIIMVIEQNGPSTLAYLENERKKTLLKLQEIQKEIDQVQLHILVNEITK